MVTLTSPEARAKEAGDDAGKTGADHNLVCGSEARVVGTISDW
jgi:hypothetical protein